MSIKSFKKCTARIKFMLWVVYLIKKALAGLSRPHLVVIQGKMQTSLHRAWRVTTAMTSLNRRWQSSGCQAAGHRLQRMGWHIVYPYKGKKLEY